MEHLVRELFELDGYSAKVLSKRAFPGYGDADVEAAKLDNIFGETKILAQVKHHKGNTDDWGIQQLYDIKERGEYADYKLVLITSGDIINDVRSKAADKDITVMDGNGLVEWIFSHLAQLSKETRARLNISNVPMFFDAQA